MMSLKNVPVLLQHRSEMVLSGDHTPEQLAAAVAVGYRNYFRVGAFEAADLVRNDCPANWSCGVAVMTTEEAPDGSVRIGQVIVHHGDQAYPLYIFPTA